MSSSSTVIIDSRVPSLASRIRDLWEARDIFRFMLRRELSGRYRGTALGRTWIVLRPTLEILVYIVVFGVMLKVSSGDMPYPLFLCAGLVPWLFFSQTVSES